MVDAGLGGREPRLALDRLRRACPRTRSATTCARCDRGDRARCAARRPVGWYTGRVSERTRRLVVEEGGFLYDSDSYADELPYWVDVSGTAHLVIPYTLDANDFKFLLPNGFVTADDFATYLVDSFDQLHAEGGRHDVRRPPLPDRRPPRPRAGARPLPRARRAPDDVWVTTRAEIARHWRAEHPAAWEVAMRMRSSGRDRWARLRGLLGDDVDATRAIYRGSRASSAAIGYGRRAARVPHRPRATPRRGPGHAFSCDGMETIIAAVQALHEAGRAKGIPVVYTTSCRSRTSTGRTRTWASGCARSLSSSCGVGIDGGRDRRAGSRRPPASSCASKKCASGFHGTNVVESTCNAHGVDTVIITGVTMVGCFAAHDRGRDRGGIPAERRPQAVGDRVPGRRRVAPVRLRRHVGARRGPRATILGLPRWDRAVRRAEPGTRAAGDALRRHVPAPRADASSRRSWPPPRLRSAAAIRRLRIAASPRGQSRIRSPQSSDAKRSLGSRRTPATLVAARRSLPAIQMMTRLNFPSASKSKKSQLCMSFCEPS